MSQNGQPTEHPSRKQKESAQEGAQGCPGVRQGDAYEGGESGASSGARKWERLLYVENAVKIDAPLRLICETTEEIKTFLRDTYGFPNASIGTLFSQTRMGSMNRIYFEGQIPPSVDTLYVRLILLKHPPM